MENASKALIMAGGMLIAVIIIGALILMYNSLRNYKNSGQEGSKEAQIVEFNNQYETYNRNDLRGSDLYSLLNKVVDYNRRKSTVGNVGNDQGQFIAYQPMEVVFNLNGKKDEFKYGSTSYLINDNEVIQNDRVNEFGNSIKAKVDEIERKYGSDSLVNLVNNISKIFDTKNKEAVYEFRSAYKRNRFETIDFSHYDINTKWEEFWNTYLADGKQVRKDVFTYYEYIQFKRAIFKCEGAGGAEGTEGTKYDSKTGRLIKLRFVFTGKFN